MLKKFKHFLIKESVSELTENDLTKFDSTIMNFFGMEEGGSINVENSFYILHDSKFYLSFNKLSYIDDKGNIRENIKIGEKLKPCIYLEIKSQPGSKTDNEVLSDIKKVIKKIRSVCKYKSKYDFNKISIQDHFIEKDDDTYNIDRDSIKSEDPFSLISVENGRIIYKDLNDEDNIIHSTYINICLYGDELTEITPELFYNFYWMSGAEYKDNKEGYLWISMDLRDIMEVVVKRDQSKYYRPEEYDFDVYYVEMDYALDDVISSASDENKKRLVDLIINNISLDDINSTLDEEYETMEEVENNLSDSDIKTLLYEYNYDIDEVGYISNSYNSWMTDKFVIGAQEYLISELEDYITEYMEFEFFIVPNDSENKDTIYIKYDPSISEDNYYYNKDNDTSEWDSWGNRVNNSNIYDSIWEDIRDHENQIELHSTVGDNIYLSSDDINDMLKDIL